MIVTHWIHWRQVPARRQVTALTPTVDVQGLTPLVRDEDVRRFEALVEGADPPTGLALSRRRRRSEALDPERRAALDQWLESNADGYTLGPWYHSGGANAAEALKGQSALGSLNSVEQLYLVEGCLTRWLEGERAALRGGMDDSAISDLCQATVGFDAGAVVGEALGRRAGRLALAAREGGDPSLQGKAQALGEFALVVCPDPEGRRALVADLDVAAEGFAWALMARERLVGEILEAIGRDAVTPGGRAFAEGAFAGLDAAVYEQYPPLQGAMALALVVLARGEGSQLASEFTEAFDDHYWRFKDLLASSGGRDVLANGRAPLAARRAARDAFHLRPFWDGEFLAPSGGRGWTHPEVVSALAAPRVARFAGLGAGMPRSLVAGQLEAVGGFALGFAPSSAFSAMTAAERRAVLVGGGNPWPEPPAVAVVAGALRHLGGDNPLVAVWPVVHGSSAAGPVALPLFQVAGAGG
ncbi:MAG: hypothetical protein ACFCBW_09020, partial [Candidatus Competibacterales bacterium]